LCLRVHRVFVRVVRRAAQSHGWLSLGEHGPMQRTHARFAGLRRTKLRQPSVSMEAPQEAASARDPGQLLKDICTQTIGDQQARWSLKLRVESCSLVRLLDLRRSRHRILSLAPRNVEGP
jgi:hypothetical protein